MLLLTKSHHDPDDALPDPENTRRMSLCKESVSPWTGTSQFLATTNKIIQFSNGREPKVIHSIGKKNHLFIRLYLFVCFFLARR